MVVATGINAGLWLHEETAALIGGIRDGRLIPRASFFQQKNIRAAIQRGDPQFLQQHEDLILFQALSNCVSSGEPKSSQRESGCPEWTSCRAGTWVHGDSGRRVG
jgi:hypothetical protein